jgi:chemotaxis protein CheC
MIDQELASEELLDYLLEVLNIGAGNAATALNQLLRCEVDVRIPALALLSTFEEAFSALGDPCLPVACSQMKMVGDVTGHMFFIVPDDQKQKLTDLAGQAMLGLSKAEVDPETVLSTLGEIGNIIAGVSLTAIHDFCKLNVYHSVPTLTVATVQAVLSEPLAQRTREGAAIILAKIEFSIGANQLKAFLLIVPCGEFLMALVASMKEAARTYGGS